MIISPRIIAGESGYTTGLQLRKAWDSGAFSQSWSLGAMMVSGKLNADHGRGLWKSFERFTPPLTNERLEDMLFCGVKHPSSYADAFHQFAPHFPRVKHTINAIFSWWPGGPWQEARTTGKHLGQWYRYDLCSAYRWASSLGLPDMTTLAVWERPPFNIDIDGLWVCTLRASDALRVPRLLGEPGPIVISSEEMRIYDVRPERIYRGVTWRALHPNDWVETVLAKLPCAKESGRAYWGRWIARDKLRCRTHTKEWELPNFSANFVWGWLVVGRVRAKVWQSARHACHVYVDEVVVPHELPTGNRMGEWRLKDTYQGIDVRRTGWYSSLGGAKIMQTGITAH